MDKYKLAKFMISLGIIMLLGSILSADMILQSYSYSISFQLQPSSTSATTLSQNSQIVIFTPAGVVINGDGLLNLQNKYVYIPTNTSNVVLFKNTNSTPGTVTENVIMIPDVLTKVIFPVFITSGILIIIGMLISLYRKLDY